jgi:hypothetical protein
MDKLGKLDTLSAASMAAAAALVVAGWIVTNAEAGTQSGGRLSNDEAVTLTDDGNMKVTVSAKRDAAPAQFARRHAVVSVRTSEGTPIRTVSPVFMNS